MLLVVGSKVLWHLDLVGVSHVLDVGHPDCLKVSEGDCCREDALPSSESLYPRGSSQGTDDEACGQSEKWLRVIRPRVFMLY
jgi:hypothetical protein